MRKIVITTHGSLAYELVDTSKVFTNSQSIVPLCIAGDDDLAKFKEKMYDEIISNSCEEVLVLADLLGGTPFNTAAQILLEYDGTKKIDIITGVNLPMLLEILIGNKDMPLSDTVQLAVNAGRNGIKSFTEEIKKRKEGGGIIEHSAK